MEVNKDLKVGYEIFTKCNSETGNVRVIFEDDNGNVIHEQKAKVLSISTGLIYDDVKVELKSVYEADKALVVL